MDLQNTQCSMNPYFENKRIRQYLINAGLINRRGNILPPKIYEVILAQRTKHKYTKAKVPPTIKKYVVEDEQNHRVVARHASDCELKRFQESKHRSMSNSIACTDQHPKPINARTSHSTSPKRPPVRAKSFHGPPTNAKNQMIRRPMTAKQLTNEDHCEVTMIYHGPQLSLDVQNNWFHPNGDEVVVMQQPCGGENLVVFKGFVKPNEIFTFESHRHPDYPFVLSLYVNNSIDSRVSVCCEYKHKHHIRLGTNRGLFGLYDVQNCQPCQICQRENSKKTKLPTSSLIVNPSLDQISSSTHSSPASSTPLRRQSPSPGRRKESSKYGIHRFPTVDQISPIPRTQSTVSSQDRYKTDEYKTHSSILTYDDKSISFDRQLSNRENSDRTLSNVSSRKSRPRSPTIPFRIEDLRLSSASSISRKSRPSLLRSSENNDGRLIVTQMTNMNYHSMRSSSNNSSESSKFISVSNQHGYVLGSSLNTSTASSNSTTIPIFNDEDDQNSTSTTIGQSNSSESTITKRTESRSSRRSTTRRRNTEQQTSRSSSNVSTIPNSTIKNEDDDHLSLFESSESSHQ